MIHDDPRTATARALHDTLAHQRLLAQRERLLADQTSNFAAKVDRVVILMLENRSFDHMLGWIGADAGGLRGDEFCPLDAPPAGLDRVGPDAGPGFRPFVTTETRLPISPSHAGNATLQQINGGNMQGFIDAFVRHREKEIPRHEDADGEIGGGPAEAMPMATFGAESLPAYAHLVRHETTCASWHASVPAGTWPNRMYLYSGHCGGLLGNGNVLIRDKPYDEAMPKQLLVDLLDQASPAVSWSVYTHSVAWMRIYPGRQRGFGRHTHPIRSFARDCRRGGEHLAQVVFIDPRFSLDIGGARLQNDDLAPADLIDGQQLVADVYRALGELPAAERERTMLVVTYDEHGGFFDHVTPPPTIGRNPEESDDFARYGVRVPAFVCSAYAPAGASSTLLLDHASLYATLHRRFVPGAPFPSRRAEVANTLGGLLTLDRPRRAFPTDDLPGNLAIAHRARRAEREARREDRREDREERRDAREERREDRREDRAERREDRRDDRAERRDDPASTRAERREDRREDRAERRDDRRQDRVERREAADAQAPRAAATVDAGHQDDGLGDWIRSLGEPDGA